MPSKLPDRKRAAILRDIRAGQARNAIARKHGVSAGTVTNIAKQAGETTAFDRSATKEATRAAEADAAALRAELKLDLLREAKTQLARTRTAYTVVVGTKDGAEMVQLPLPPLGEVRSAFTSAAIAIDKSIAIERHDNAGDGHDEKRAALANLAEAMGWQKPGDG